MPYELHFTCTASAHLGAGKRLKKLLDADLRVLHAASYKKTQTEMPNDTAPWQAHLRFETCQEKQGLEAMHLNLKSNYTC